MGLASVLLILMCSITADAFVGVHPWRNPETNRDQINGAQEIIGNKRNAVGDTKRGYMDVKATSQFQRTSTGPVIITEVDGEGRSIVIENTSTGANRQDISLDGWKLQKTVDGVKRTMYPFKGFILKAGRKVKIFGRAYAYAAGITDLVMRDYDTWGVGANTYTSLVNEKGEEKATHARISVGINA